MRHEVVDFAMEAYETLGIIGEGTYGVVMKARNRATGKLVAIKRFKQSDEDDHVRKTSTREVRMLQQLKHPNVVRLEDVFRREGKLYLVFEYIEKNILQVLESTTHGIPPCDLRCYMYQLLRGLEFCHAHNVIHRDVKPENVLIDKSGILKLCDFGFARQMTSKGKYTDYVATRWYRAPELLVGDVSYGKPVDVWALGCMFAELSDGQPLFPGESDLDQLCLIIQTCGPVPDRMVSIFEHNPLYRNVSYPHTGIVYTLQERYHRQPEDWLEFLYACLHPDPAKRLTCTELMALPYFTRDGFRERCEQELRAMSGLPLLRANQTPSVPSSTLRTVADTISGGATGGGGGGGGAKSTLDVGVLALANTNVNAAAVDVTASPSDKKRPSVGQKAEVGRCSSMEMAKSKSSEGDGNFLPVVPLPASVPPEVTVQLPRILNQSTDKATAADAAREAGEEEEEEAGRSSSTHRHRGSQIVAIDAAAFSTPVAGTCGIAEALQNKQLRSEPFSQSCSGVLSSRRTSSASSFAASPAKKSDNTIIGSTRQLSDVVDSVESGAVVVAQVPAMTAATSSRGVGESRRSSRSYSNVSPRSLSLQSERSEAKLCLATAVVASSSVSSPGLITDLAPKAASEQQLSPQSSLAPLAERLPDLTSPELQFPSHDKRGSVDMDNIPKLPSQPPYPASPISFNGSTVSQPSLNPLAAPLRERGTGRHTLAKARRHNSNIGGPYDVGDVPHVYQKKKLVKRKKEGIARRSSHGSGSHRTSCCSPHEQTYDALLARGVNEHIGHDGAKQGSTSVSAFKLSTSRSSPHVADASRSHHLHEQEEAFNQTLEEERANRMRGTVSGQNTPGTTATGRRGVDSRGSMPRKERRSKPLHSFSNTGPHVSDGHSHPQPPVTQQHQQQQQPSPPLDTFLRPGSTDVAQRASATLLALSALRDSTASFHQPPSHDGVGVGGAQDKFPHNHHTQAAASIGPDYGVALPPKTQSKESGAAGPKKAPPGRSRKPLGVYMLHSSRRSLDEGNSANPAMLCGHDTNALASLPSSQGRGFAVPCRRSSKTGGNSESVQPVTSLSSVAPQQQAAKKSRKKRSSVSGEVNGGGGGVALYTGGHQKDFSSSPAHAGTMGKLTPRRRENSGSSRKPLPLVYNVATATATQM